MDGVALSGEWAALGVRGRWAVALQEVRFFSGLPVASKPGSRPKYLFWRVAICAASTWARWKGA